jgi:hypothetical protein
LPVTAPKYYKPDSLTFIPKCDIITKLLGGFMGSPCRQQAQFDAIKSVHPPLESASAYFFCFEFSPVRTGRKD